MIGLFDDGVFDRIWDKAGHDNCVHVFLVQNIKTGDIIILYVTDQIASTIERVSTI